MSNLKKKNITKYEQQTGKYIKQAQSHFPHEADMVKGIVDQIQKPHYVSFYIFNVYISAEDVFFPCKCHLFNSLFTCRLQLIIIFIINNYANSFFQLDINKKLKRMVTGRRKWHTVSILWLQHVGTHFIAVKSNQQNKIANVCKVCVKEIVIYKEHAFKNLIYVNSSKLLPMALKVQCVRIKATLQMWHSY